MPSLRALTRMSVLALKTMVIDLQELSGAAVVCVALPTLALCAMGLWLHHVIDTRHAGFSAGISGKGGLSVAAVSWRGVVYGASACAVAALPVPFDIASMLATLVFTAAAAFLAWRSRAPFAGAFCALAAMIVSAGLTQVVVVSLHRGAGGIDASASWFTALAIIWPLLALPGLVGASIAAFLNMNSAPADALPNTSTPTAPPRFPAATPPTPTPTTESAVRVGTRS